MPKYGFNDDAWDRAMEQAKAVMVDVARREGTIPYSDIVARINAITLDPHSYATRAFLGEISTAEHTQGRGMLSVVVVHKHGEQMPGLGFFELARSLGFKFRDETEFWLNELRKVYGVWSRRD
jgi:hypothetical protein